MEQLYKNANAVVGLQRLYARLRGELKRIDRESTKLLDDTERKLSALTEERAARAQQMEHVEANLALLRPGIALDHIQPVVTTKRLAVLRHGDLRSEILAILKVSGGWLTAAAIHDELVARNGIAFSDYEQKRRHRQHLRVALHVMAKLEPPRVEREHDLPKGDFKTEQRWRLGVMFRE